MENSNIKLQPVLSVKSNKVASASNKYTFKLDAEYSKDQVRKAIEDKYKVKVIDIRTVTIPGKIKKNWKTNIKTRKQDYKKAIVELAKDNKIDEFFKVKNK